MKFNQILFSQDCIRPCAAACREHHAMSECPHDCVQATGRSQRVVATFDLQGPGPVPAV